MREPRIAALADDWCNAAGGTRVRMMKSAIKRH